MNYTEKDRQKEKEAREIAALIDKCEVTFDQWFKAFQELVKYDVSQELVKYDVSQELVKYDVSPLIQPDPDKREKDLVRLFKTMFRVDDAE